MKRRCISAASLADHGQNIGGVLIRQRFDGRNGALAGLRERRVNATPRSLAAAKATFVRWLIIVHSFSASAANRCKMNGSTSAPSSATTKGTRWAIKPLMK